MLWEDFKVGTVFSDDYSDLCQVVKKTYEEIVFIDSGECFSERVYKRDSNLDWCVKSRKKMPAYHRIGDEAIERFGRSFQAGCQNISNGQMEKAAIWVLEQLGWEISR